MGWSPESKRFQFHSFEIALQFCLQGSAENTLGTWTRCRKLPWMEKWGGDLHRQCYFFFFAAFFSRMTNLLLFTMACLLFGRLTRGGYWEEMGVTCDLEPHDVTVCGTKVQVKRCRGTCRSISRITMGFPYYRKYCQCCQGNTFTDKTVSCAGGGHKKIRYPAECSCQNC